MPEMSPEISPGILSAAVDGEGVLSGNELTEAVMFGSTAGTEAAVYVSDNQ